MAFPLDTYWAVSVDLCVSINQLGKGLRGLGHQSHIGRVHMFTLKHTQGLSKVSL